MSDLKEKLIENMAQAIYVAKEILGMDLEGFINVIRAAWAVKADPKDLN